MVFLVSTAVYVCLPNIASPAAMKWNVALVALATCLTVSAKQPCPVYGAQYPPLRNIKDHRKVKNFSKALDEAFSRRIGPSGLKYSYVAQFYTAEDGVIWQTKYTSPELKALNNTGVKEVDENTVHRVGSITKLFNVLTFLVKVGDTIWNEPITKYIPELNALAPRSRVYNVDWEEITVGSLANYNSGLIRDCTVHCIHFHDHHLANRLIVSLLGELTEELEDWRTRLPAFGWPLIPEAEVPKCGKKRTCTRKGTKQAPGLNLRECDVDI